MTWHLSSNVIKLFYILMWRLKKTIMRDVRQWEMHLVVFGSDLAGTDWYLLVVLVCWRDVQHRTVSCVKYRYVNTPGSVRMTSVNTNYSQSNQAAGELELQQALTNTTLWMTICSSRQPKSIRGTTKVH